MGSKTILPALCGVGALLTAAGWAGGWAITGPAMVVTFALLGVYCQSVPKLQVLTFASFVLAMVAWAMFYPAHFTTWGGFPLNTLIVPLIQIIMFGMGASLSVGDFARALKMPQAVLIGMGLQFTVMPVLEWMTAKAFGFESEVAAGVVLIGACSGGVASNVMVFLARGNVALSVTMTSCSTLAAPIMTPLAMRLLAGEFIEINPLKMMLDIINLVIIPVGGGLVANKILEHKRPLGDLIKLLIPLTLVISGGVALVTAGGRAVAGEPVWDGLANSALILAAITVCVGFLFNAVLAGDRQAFDKFLPVLSMASICFILAIIAAGSREELISVGFLLLLAALIHNTAGYLFGYLLAGAAGLAESDRRTVAFEVGMQNGGMGVGLARSALNSSAAALAPAIFGTWMNITGSVLAGWWREKPVENA